jgi:methylphosphotriester-DNA--protein-cysteine methyltransferase
VGRDGGDMQHEAPAAERRPHETSVRIRLPDERVQCFATFYYFVDVVGPLEDFLYPEWGNVRFWLSGDWWVDSRELRRSVPRHGSLFGPTDRAMRVVTHDGSTAGFGLTPLGWQRLFDLPAEALANRITALGDLMGAPGEALHAAVAAADGDEARAALFDRLLLDRLAQRAPNTEEAIRVDRALRDRPADVGAFGEKASMSPRALKRVCKRVFGFGPKRLLRRQRFLDTLGRVRVADEVSFTNLRDASYFDQSHFNHEFHEFMGLSPRRYLSVPRPLMGQAALVQLQQGIPLSFALPPPPDA